MAMDCPKYKKEDAEEYFNNPKYEAAEKKMYQDMGIDTEDMPVGAFNDFVSVKGEPEILQKTQYNIKDRFGYCSKDDEMDY